MFDRQFDRQWNLFLEKKANDLKLTPSQTRVFLTRFKHQNWLKTREDIWESSGVKAFESFVRHLTDVFKALKPYCSGIGRGAGNFYIARDCLLKEFKVLNSPSSSLELFISEKQECDRAISHPGALIRIKAPSKMGKTRLLNSILNSANERNYATVNINLLQIESAKFKSLDLFLRWFCTYLSDALNLHSELNNYWSQDRGSMQSCTRYLEAVLTQFEQPLVIAFDDLDRLIGYPEISQDFFYLLRSWHEDANSEEIWEQLRLIVVYSTEDFGNLDINRSPFNVGLPIELKFIPRSQLVQLAHNYNLDLSAVEIDRLLTLLGGHPYLVDLLLTNLAGDAQFSLDDLLKEVASDKGIYGSYLRQHLINLQANSQLTEIFLQILNSSQPIQVDTLLGYQLYRMGLVKWSENNSVVPSCELFRQYFLPRLKHQ
ncbi:MAG: AAA-like domain-containing protein [Cyanobacteria bacterium J06600_6]